jgi:hypothetical protein
VRARRFPFSLLGKALRWFHTLPAESKQDWEALMRKFMNTYELNSLSGISVYLKRRMEKMEIEKEAQHLKAAEVRSTCKECEEYDHVQV